jgi:hypothetical protein
MSIELQVGSEVFEYPVNGTNAIESWGEQTSGWAQAVTDVLATVNAPNDITLTTVSLNDNVSSPANIVGLKFPTISILSVKIEYIIKRIIGAIVLTESGVIYGNYNSTDFFISQESVGDAGIYIDVTSGGQFTYTSSNLGQTSCILKFKASTISN